MYNNIVKFNEKCSNIVAENSEKLLVLKGIINSNIEKARQIQLSFTGKFNSLIEVVESFFTANPHLVVVDDISPASINTKTIPRWPGEEAEFVHKDQSILTISTTEPLSADFEVRIAIHKATSGHVVVGVSKEVLNLNRGYLGGDLGKGNWGIACNGSLGENGSWKTGKGYVSGDIVTIKGQSGMISYAINDDWQNYCFQMEEEELFLAASFYYSGDRIEILD